jgi:hypothetical protein
MDSAATDVLLPWVAQQGSVCFDWGRWYYRRWSRGEFAVCLSYRRGRQVLSLGN